MASKNRPRPKLGIDPLRNSSIILLATGFALFAGGIALVVAPEYSERARSMAEAIDRFSGIQSGVLLLGGLVFFSLGVLGRGIIKTTSTVRLGSSPQRGEDGVDVSLVVEQLAGDMVQLRTAVDQLSSHAAKTAEVLQRLLDGQDSRDGGGQQPHDNDPLFRLAASLDHMNARIDERFKALTARLDESLASPREL